MKTVQQSKKIEVKKPRRKSRASDFGNEIVQKTVLWSQTISAKTAMRIDAALKRDEHVIEYGLVDKALLEKVLCLEIKRWKVVTQLTNKIVTQLDESEIAIVVHGHNKEDPGSVKYQFRKLCEKFMIDTSYLGVANSKQKKAAYYAAKKFKQTGKKNQAYLVNELASKLSGEYMLRAGTDEIARGLLADIIVEVRSIIEARVN
jgi:enterochelin esterase-like enzyme